MGRRTIWLPAKLERFLEEGARRQEEPFSRYVRELLEFGLSVRTQIRGEARGKV